MTAARHDPFKVQAPYHGIYSHGVSVSGPHKSLHLSGQYGVQPDGELADGFSAQCRQAILNLEAVLADAHMGLQHLVKMNFFLTDRRYMDELVSVRKELLEGVRPAITTVIVAGLVSPDWLVEVDGYAELDSTALIEQFDRQDAVRKIL